MTWLICEDGGRRATMLPAHIATLAEADAYLRGLLEQGRLPGEVPAWVIAWVPADAEALAQFSDFGALAD